MNLFDDGIDYTPEFKPNMVWIPGMKEMFTGVSEESKVLARNLRDSHGWKFYSVSQNRGRCYYQQKVITIPKWVIQGIEGKALRKGYKEYYICHEMAHAYVKEHGLKNDIHGPNFMKEFKEICPLEYQHFELDYKPRNAKIAGIILEL